MSLFHKDSAQCVEPVYDMFVRDDEILVKIDKAQFHTTKMKLLVKPMRWNGGWAIEVSVVVEGVMCGKDNYLVPYRVCYYDKSYPKLALEFRMLGEGSILGKASVEMMTRVMSVTFYKDEKFSKYFPETCRRARQNVEYWLKEELKQKKGG